tara:strand:- start:7987 stop:8466 length:480 start_codon:yes stop_codon:yes gene_type:complete
MKISSFNNKSFKNSQGSRNLLEDSKILDSYNYQNKHPVRISRKLYLSMIHKVIDSINIMIVLSVLLGSFFTIRSQSKWTNVYSNLNDLREVNKSYVDSIAFLEKYYLDTYDVKTELKVANPEDLIYLRKPDLDNIVLRKSGLMNNLLDQIFLSPVLKGY